MDPLPAANDAHLPVSQEGAQLLRQGVSHRDAPSTQRPVPSDQLFPPVEDDRVHKLKPGPPEPDEA